MAISIEPVAERNVDAMIQMVLDLARYEQLKVPDEDAQKRLRSDVLGPNPRYEG